MRWGPAPDALFGPDSYAWRVSARWWVIFGGQRALLMQVAEPAVAAGVAEHSAFPADALGRLFRTLDTMLRICFAPAAVAAETVAGLERTHARVRGTIPGGGAYSAGDPELAMWVHATLVDTALEVERRFVNRLGDEGRAGFYAESRVLARVLGVPSDLVPHDLDGFERYVAKRVGGLQPSAQSREVAAGVMWPRVGPLPPRIWWPVTSLAYTSLPDTLRAAYGFGEPSVVQDRYSDAVAATSRRLVPLLGDRCTLNPLLIRSLGRPVYSTS